MYLVSVVLLLAILPVVSVVLEGAFSPHGVNIMGWSGNGTSSGPTEYGYCWPGSGR